MLVDQHPLIPTETVSRAMVRHTLHTDRTILPSAALRHIVGSRDCSRDTLGDEQK